MSAHQTAEIRLINQVVVHLGYLSEDQAAKEVADHVRKFWDPRMKRRLFDLVDSDSSDLEPVALAATALLR